MGTPNEACRIFVGYDPRQAVAFNVLSHSIIARAQRRISIEPLILETLPIDRMGLTPFTFSRFLVPWLCNFEGPALFLDADMLCLGDIGDLFDFYDPQYAVQVVKTTERFEWASAMLFNCGHPDNAVLTPEAVQQTTIPLHKIEWTDLIGELPPEWNHTVLYDQPNPNALLVHFTGGIPLHKETRGCEFTSEWAQEATDMNTTMTWEPLMGHSVHAQLVMQTKVQRELKACADGSDSKNNEKA